MTKWLQVVHTGHVTESRFSHSHTTSAHEQERMWAPMWDHRQSVVTQYLTFNPDSDLAKRLEEAPQESQARTDAIGAVEEESADGWQIRWVIAEQSGALVARSVHLEPIDKATPEGGITARLLRELSPARALASFDPTAIQERDGGVVDDLTPLLIRYARDEVTRVGPDPSPSRVRGRPRLTDDLLARVAIAYLEELPRGRGLLPRIGERPEIISAAAESQRSGTRQGGPIPAQTVRDWVHRARADHFLTGTKAGRKGATPGPRLVEYLRERTGDAK